MLPCGLKFGLIYCAGLKPSHVLVVAPQQQLMPALGSELPCTGPVTISSQCDSMRSLGRCWDEAKETPNTS